MSYFKNIVLLACVSVFAASNCCATKKPKKENTEENKPSNPLRKEIEKPVIKRQKAFHFGIEGLPEKDFKDFFEKKAREDQDPSDTEN
ncbi:hypothetical protein Bealeia1_01527 [Candidatus Bealeia paramacronuclearis]|uniref:Uncharacterized protein n=1 Tax=Candidatus Bealeia paramacronuclearis TaxID=1921001 RepID=A0ABZ2C4M5_9PROT|nr:hypothetical protein [Candidatus Bealeia paramacronuclearis]